MLALSLSRPKIQKRLQGKRRSAGRKHTHTHLSQKHCEEMPTLETERNDLTRRVGSEFADGEILNVLSSHQQACDRMIPSRNGQRLRLQAKSLAVALRFADAEPRAPGLLGLILHLTMNGEWRGNGRLRPILRKNKWPSILI